MAGLQAGRNLVHSNGLWVGDPSFHCCGVAGLVGELWYVIQLGFNRRIVFGPSPVPVPGPLDSSFGTERSFETAHVYGPGDMCGAGGSTRVGFLGITLSFTESLRPRLLSFSTRARCGGDSPLARCRRTDWRSTGMFLFLQVLSPPSSSPHFSLQIHSLMALGLTAGAVELTSPDGKVLCSRWNPKIP